MKKRHALWAIVFGSALAITGCLKANECTGTGCNMQFTDWVTCLVGC